MAWNADGTFSRSYDWTDERDAGNNISATKFDTENDTFATGIQNCINKDGKNSPSTDLPMGGNKHTGVGDGSARTHYGSVGQIQDGGVVWGGTSGGAANVQTMSLTPAITAYATGMQIAFKAGFTNTGNITVNVNSIGAKNLYSGGAACRGGEVTAGQLHLMVYDGTRFHLLSRNDPTYAVSVFNSSTQSIPNSTATPVEFDTERYDYGSMHSTVTNTGRLIAPVTGIYSASAFISFASNATGNRRVAIYGPNVGVVGETNIVAAGTGSIALSVAADFEIDAADYVVIYAEQSSGGNLNVEGSCFAHMHLVRASGNL